MKDESDKQKHTKLNNLVERYKPIPMKRLFYPRGMKLSEDFVNAFHREYDRLVDEGLNPKTLIERVGKAMSFHVNDPRKYKLLDEEQARLAGLEEKKRPLPSWLNKDKDNKDENGEEDKKPTNKDENTKSNAHKKKHK